MKNLSNYKEFLLNESYGNYFLDKKMSKKYPERAKSVGLTDNPTILKKVYDFFNGMEERINKMADLGKTYQDQRRSERGGKLNTGIESLFGAASVVPNVLKRVFGPTNYSIGKKINSDESVDLDLLRHTNQEFIKNELPRIKTKNQLETNLEELYQRGGVKVKQSPILDEIARNRSTAYYMREMNPNSPIFQ